MFMKFGFLIILMMFGIFFVVFVLVFMKVVLMCFECIIVLYSILGRFVFMLNIGVLIILFFKLIWGIGLFINL